MTGMMRTAAVLAMVAAGMTGCDSKKTVTAENASTTEVAQKVKASGIAEGGFISPGRWQMTMTIKDMKVPGMPPEMAKRMQGSLDQPRSFEHCVTEAEAKKPKEDFFAGEQAKSCRYETFTLGGGKIDAVMRCESGGGGKQVMRLNGTYSADAYRMTIASAVEGGGPDARGMTLNATVDAKRLGVCTGKEAG